MMPGLAFLTALAIALLGVAGLIAAIWPWPEDFDRGED